MQDNKKVWVNPTHKNNYAKYLIGVLFVFLFIGGVSGVECGQTPTDNCDVTTSTTFAFDTYYLNGSTDGAIRPSANHIVIDCNGSTFIGNYSDTPSWSGSRFSKANTFDNVTLLNCNIDNYYFGVIMGNGVDRLILSNITFNNTYEAIEISYDSTDLVINNSIFYNSSYMSIYAPTPPSTQNVWERLNITNNIFKDNTQIRGIRLLGRNFTRRSNNVYLYNNVMNFTNGNLRVDYTDGVVLDNNYLKGDAERLTTAIELRNVSSVRLVNNTIDGNQWGVYIVGVSKHLIADEWICTGESNNIDIINNTFKNLDVAVWLDTSRNNLVKDNLFYNVTNNVDIYNLNVFNGVCSSDTIIDSNRFEMIGTHGVYGASTNNISIINNIFDFMPFSDRLTSSFTNNYGEPSIAISFGELLESFVQTNHSQQVGNITFLSTMNSKNINISNNTFDSDTPVLLLLQNSVNVTHDLSSYWYRRFQLPTILHNPFEYYISNNFNEITILTNYTGFASSGFESDILRVSYRNNINYFNYSMSKTNLMFLNTNLTDSYILTLYNLSTLTPYNDIRWDNGTIVPYESLGNEINITIPAGQYLEVGDYNTAFSRTELRPYCTNIVNGFTEFGQLLVIIILAITLIFVMSMIMDGTLNGKDFLVTSIITLVFVVVINIFGAIIVAYMC